MPGRRPSSRALLGAALLAAVLGIGAGAAGHLAFGSRSAQPSLALPALRGQAVWTVGRRPAPAFALADETGRTIALADLRGRSVLLAFMDPLCRQECPIEGRALAAAERQVAPAQRAALLIVSVNPKATGADAKAASRKWGVQAHWLLGSRTRLARVWRAYGIAVIPTRNDIVHSTAVYVIDGRGFERAGFIAPFLPQFLADDLRTLAHGAA